MKKNKIIISIPRLEKEHTITDDGILTSEIFDVESNEFLILDSNLNYRYKAQMLPSGVVINGTASTQIKTRCSRCLTPLIEDIDCKYTLYFDEINSDELDITEEIREELMLEIPMSSLCDEDCEGLEDSSENEKMKEPSVWDALDNLVCSQV